MVELDYGQLMAQAQNGDEESYEKLLNQLAVLLKKFFNHRLKVKIDMSDLVQETLISIHKARGSYRPGEPFLNWFYAIAHYRLNDYLRVHYKNEVRFLKAEPFILDQFADASYIEKNIDIKFVLSQLPIKYQQVIYLLKVQGYSIKETAKKIKSTEGATKVLAHRAYQLFKKKWFGYS